MCEHHAGVVREWPALEKVLVEGVELFSLSSRVGVEHEDQSMSISLNRSPASLVLREGFKKIYIFFLFRVFPGLCPPPPPQKKKWLFRLCPFKKSEWKISNIYPPPLLNRKLYYFFLNRPWSDPLTSHSSTSALTFLLLTLRLDISNSRILAPAVGLYSPPMFSVASDRKFAIIVLPDWQGPTSTIFTLNILNT